MSKQILNIKARNFRKCAFCKYWYDPINQNISPKSPHIGMWEFDDNAKCLCLQKNIQMMASAFCDKYDCKVPD